MINPQTVNNASYVKLSLHSPQISPQNVLSRHKFLLTFNVHKIQRFEYWTTRLFG